MSGWKKISPHQHLAGVIRWSDEGKVYPESRDNMWENLDANTCLACKSFLKLNSEDRIGRIKSFTANNFFKACAVGYRACGYETDGKTPTELYLIHADGRDEGLTGTGHGLNEGPGIDFDDPAAWDGWYFGKRGGGHPWEVIRGGNSTHVDLFVCHDEYSIGFRHRLGEISDGEYEKLQENAGYFFRVTGKHRPEESISFFVALREEGLPVVLSDAEGMMARYDGADYIGIVPHRIIPQYCEDMFPDEYGRVIDFMHVYEDEIDALRPYITWLPEEKAELIGTQN